MHAVGEHLPHKASGAPRRRHLLIPAGFRLLLRLPRFLQLHATPAPRATRRRGSGRLQLRLQGRRLSRRARGLRASQAAPVGLPRAPSLPRRRAPLACPLSLLLGGAGGNWRRKGGLGVCPAGEGTGRGPGLLSARRGGAGGAPGPRSGSWGLGAGRRCGRRRRRQGEQGREGKGGERGEGKRGEGLRAGGGARTDGEGLSPARPGRATLPSPQTQGSFGERRLSESEPSAPPSWLSVSQRICDHLSVPCTTAISPDLFKEK